MVGYFFVFWAASSEALSAGPGYRTVRLGRLLPCEGGLKRVGFSRTGTLEAGALGLAAFGFGALVDAARMVREVGEEGEERRGRQVTGPRGRRKRGIEADIVRCQLPVSWIGNFEGGIIISRRRSPKKEPLRTNGQEQKYYGRRGRPRAFSAALVSLDPRSPESTATTSHCCVQK